MPALDGVRGIALLAVLVFHFVAHGPGSAAWPAWVTNVAALGWAGVDLFFVLSGFLITRILLASRGRPGASRVFYARRALRIFPPYYAMLLAMTLTVFVLDHGRPGRETLTNLAALWLYLTNFNVAAHGFGAAIFHKVQLTHLWTLAIEEQFYLVWPWVVLWLRPRWTVAVATGLVIIAPLCRLFVLRHSDQYEAAYVLTQCRADALAWGALAALAEAWPLARRRAVGRLCQVVGVVLFAATLALAGSASEYARPVQLIGYSALAMTCAGWVTIVAADERPSWLAWAGLRRVGVYAYGAYLIHVPLRGVASAAWQAAGRDPAALPLPWAALTAATLVAATIGLAAVSYHLFERPLLRLKPKLPRV